METTMNTVNIELSKYNDLTSKLNEKTASLELLKSEIAALRTEKANRKEDKVIIVEQREEDRYGRLQTTNKLVLDITSPESSEKVLELISKVETADLDKKIKAKDKEIETLTRTISDMQREKAIEYDERSLDARKKEIIRQKDRLELVKNYEDQITTLKDEKMAVTKALEELKTNKTQEQLEVARQLEIDQLKEKLSAIEELNSQIMERSSNPIKLRTFLNSVKNTKQFIANNERFSRIWRSTQTALENVLDYAKVIKSVGRSSKQEVVEECQKTRSRWDYSPVVCW